MKRITFIIAFLILLISCRKQEQFKVQSIRNSSHIDTIIISDLITESIISKISVSSSKIEKKYKLDYPIIGNIQTKDGKHEYLIALTKNKIFGIIINNDSTISTNNLSDSLLNYLWHSTMPFIGKNSELIFTSNKKDSIVYIFEKFKIQRDSVINKYSKRLTRDELELLKFQNSARIYSFLFWLGRESRQIDIKNSFYRFANQIDKNSIWLKTLPDIALYKYEIEYFNNNDSLTSIKSFVDYIELKTKNTDLAEFLKYRYLKGLIESPSTWRNQINLMNSKTLKGLLESEQKNKYYYLFNKSAESYFTSAKGEVAYDFIAENSDGKSIKLSDFKGKVVFIDVWASWCGACIQQRPNTIALIQKFKNNSDVKILLISVDASKDKWLEFLKKDRNNHDNVDFIVQNGMKTDFGKHYNIKFIPRYILIDKKGTIIDSDLPEPSIEVEEMINKVLERR